jgi:Protein O-mannosyl-transferase TMEM260-like
LAGSRARALVSRIDPTAVASILTGVGAFAVYRATLLPGLASWDTGEAQTVAPILGTLHPTGFPAYVVLGWLATHALAPLGSPAFLMNLLSAGLVAVAVAVCVVVNRRLGTGLVISVAAAIGFALTPAVWHLGVAADVHSLHLALLAVEVALLLRWEGLVEAGAAVERADRALVLAAAVFGVMVANHALSLLLVLPIGLYVRAVDRPVFRRRRTVLAAVGTGLGIAALLYLELPLRAGLLRAPLVYGHPETWGGFWEIVLARQFQGDLLGALRDLPGTVDGVLRLLTTQLGPFILLLPVALFATALRRHRYALLSGVAALLTVLFAASYQNAAIDRYYAGPVLFAWTWLAVLASEVVRLVGELVALGGRAVVRLALAVAAVALGAALLLPTGTVLASRWQTVSEADLVWPEAWLDQAFAAFAPHAVVISWWSYSTPLWYGQLVEGRRPDVWVVDDRTRLDDDLGSVRDVVEANIDTRPVYLIRVQDSEIEALTDRFRIEPVGLPGNLYRVTGRKETSP